MIKLTDNIEEASFVTHAGNFHADDVFSTVFLERLYGNITLIRLKEYTSDSKKLAYDIGLGKFDHHGTNYDKKRPNGIHYCSFGLLWQKFGLEYLGKINIANKERVFAILDELLVTQIDAFDNGEYNLDAPFNIYQLLLFPPIIQITLGPIPAGKSGSYIFPLVNHRVNLLSPRIYLFSNFLQIGIIHNV